MEAHHMDDVYRVLGTWGKFQVWHVLWIVIDVFPEVFAILSAVFTGYIHEYQCTELPVENVTATNSSSFTSYTYQQCDYNIYDNEGNTSSLVGTHKCDEYSYAKENTYATEWNLVCSRSNLAALAQSLVLAGQGIGALTMSHLADRFGRKTVHVLSHIGVMTTMAVIAFSQNIYMLLALRLVAGTFQQGMVCTGKILTLEMFPKEVRSYMEVITFLAWTAGIITLTGFGYVFRDLDWRYLQAALAIFSLYSIAQWWMLEESVRWLLSNGQTEEAERILRKAAKWNKVDYSKVEAVWSEKTPLPLSDLTTDDGYSAMPNVDGSDKKELTTSGNGQIATTNNASLGVEKYTVLDILKNPSLRVNTIILWYSWIVATGSYYGLTLVSAHMSGDRFVNFFLSGLIEVPSLLLEFYLFNKIGRKKTLILWYALAGVSLITSTALLTVLSHVRSVNIIATGFSLLGKMAITGSFSTVFLYTPEIYPTNYRKIKYG